MTNLKKYLLLAGVAASAVTPVGYASNPHSANNIAEDLFRSAYSGQIHDLKGKFQQQIEQSSSVPAFVEKFKDEVMPGIRTMKVEQEIQDPLAKRLFDEKLSMDKMEALNKAAEAVCNFKVSDQDRKNLVNALNKKLEMLEEVNAAYQDDVNSVDNIFKTVSQEDSAYLKAREEGFSFELSNLLGKTLMEEMDKTTFKIQQTDGPDQKIRKASAFLKNKVKRIESGNAEDIFKMAAETMFIKNMGLADFSVEEVFLRTVGDTKEFGGVALYNKNTGQTFLVFAGASKWWSIARVGKFTAGDAITGANLGLKGDQAYFDWYNQIHSKVSDVTDRLKAQAAADGKKLDILAIGEKKAASEALQAVYNIKNRHGSEVNAGVIGFQMPKVYADDSATKVENVIGKENIVFNAEKFNLLNVYDQHVVGLKKVGMSFDDALCAFKKKATAIANDVKAAAKDIANDIKETVQEIASDIKETAKEAANDITTTVKKVTAPEPAKQGFFRRIIKGIFG